MRDPNQDTPDPYPHTQASQRLERELRKWFLEETIGQNGLGGPEQRVSLNRPCSRREKLKAELHSSAWLRSGQSR